jgi:hypothetical protein
MKDTPCRIAAPVIACLLIVVLTGVIPQRASSQNLPTNLRVDIADGNTGQLFISWTQPTGGTSATYFTLQRSTSSGSGYATVANCSSTANFINTSTPFNSSTGPTFICRDNNGGTGLTVSTPTSYYYRIEACTSTNCSGYTATTPPVFNSTYNIPLSCNCTQGNAISQIPPMIWDYTYGGQNAWQNLKPPTPNSVKADVVDTTPGLYGPNDSEIYAVANAGVVSWHIIRYQAELLVELPGSGGSCAYSPIMYTAQNLGFDTICVNYSNKTEQETICDWGTPPNGDPGCFGTISQAKFDGSGPCGVSNTDSLDCGYDPSTGAAYYNGPHDAVYSRILTMLEYLTGNTGASPCDISNPVWGQYLLAEYQTETDQYCAPNWSKMILGGWSQGGDMATYTAGLENANETPIVRAINWSAPPQAVVYNDNMTAATYLSGWFTGASIRDVFGLVSANDTHYNIMQGDNDLSVYQAVWTAMGFIAGSPGYDGEWDLNCTKSTETSLCKATTTQALSCSGTPSNNLVNFAAVNPYAGNDGHVDPTYIWNQDIYEFMLLDN